MPSGAPSFAPHVPSPAPRSARPLPRTAQIHLPWLSSPRSASAIGEQLVSEAERLNARLLVVASHGPGERLPKVGGSTPRPARCLALRAGRSVLRRAARRAPTRPLLVTDHCVLAGALAEFGSVARWCFQHSPVPLVLVPSGGETPAPLPWRHRLHHQHLDADEQVRGLQGRGGRAACLGGGGRAPRAQRCGAFGGRRARTARAAVRRVLGCDSTPEQPRGRERRQYTQGWGAIAAAEA